MIWVVTEGGRRALQKRRLSLRSLLFLTRGRTGKRKGAMVSLGNLRCIRVVEVLVLATLSFGFLVL